VGGAGCGGLVGWVEEGGDDEAVDSVWRGRFDVVGEVREDGRE